MIRRNSRWWSLPTFARHNDGAAGGAGAGAGGAGGGDGGGGGNPPANLPVVDKKFSQADVDRFMAEERRKLQAKHQTLAQELEQFKSKASLTEEEKTALTARIEELQNQSLTKEQQLTRDLEKAQNEAKTIRESLVGERDTWQQRYATLLVEQNINKAAVDHKAYRAEQVLDLLKPKAKVAPVLGDDGKPTDKFQVLIKFEDLDPKTKQPVTLELTPADTVKRMTELPELFGNLFQSGVVQGVGKTRQGGTAGEPDVSKMSPAEFREWRKTRGK
jgi:hypothetical protein